MTSIILFALFTLLLGFGFHTFFGRNLQTLPLNLLAALGGAIVGLTAAIMLGWDFWSVGGVPMLSVTAGALLFLILIQRIKLEEELT